MGGREGLIDTAVKTAETGKRFELMVPTQTGKMGEHFPVREKSGNFTQKLEKSEKLYWKSQGNLTASNSENPANMAPYLNIKRNFKNIGKVREVCQSEKVGTMKRY